MRVFSSRKKKREIAVTWSRNYTICKAEFEVNKPTFSLHEPRKRVNIYAQVFISSI